MGEAIFITFDTLELLAYITYGIVSFYIIGIIYNVFTNKE